MTRQRWHRSDYKFEQWEKYYSEYPDGTPRISRNIVQNWSDDLEISSNHLVSQLGQGNQDIGGPFLVKRRIYDEWSSLGKGAHVFSHPWGYFEGVVRSPQFARYADFNNAQFPIVDMTNPIELMALGREAISLTAPTKSSFDGAEFIGELREGLPSIIPFAQNSKSRTARARNAGDEYLNVEFGWKPLLRDFESFRNTVVNAERILDDYEKRSNRLIHVSHTFPISQSQEINDLGAAFAAPLIDQTNLWEPGGYLGSLRQTITSETRRWFKGTFMYYFPSRGDSLRKAAELQKLYGLKPSPDVFWNLAPWSWAADWIGDAGTLAKNLTLFSNDNLIMPWAYIMETKSVTVEWQLSGLRYRAYPGEQTLRQSFTTIVKSRLQASPYGFDLDWPDLSGRQIAILAALGRSRA